MKNAIKQGLLGCAGIRCVLWWGSPHRRGRWIRQPPQHDHDGDGWGDAVAHRDHPATVAVTAIDHDARTFTVKMSDEERPTSRRRPT